MRDAIRLRVQRSDNTAEVIGAAIGRKRVGVLQFFNRRAEVCVRRDRVLKAAALSERRGRVVRAQKVCWLLVEIHVCILRVARVGANGHTVLFVQSKFESDAFGNQRARLRAPRNCARVAILVGRAVVDGPCRATKETVCKIRRNLGVAKQQRARGGVVASAAVGVLCVHTGFWIEIHVRILRVSGVCSNGHTVVFVQSKLESDAFWNCGARLRAPFDSALSVAILGGRAIVNRPERGRSKIRPRKIRVHIRVAIE